MPSYDHPSIWINGRFVAITEIEARTTTAQNSFEESTFSFISAWLRGATQFEILTSGSTGSPKPISISREQMIASATLTGKVLNLVEGDSCLICIDTKYIGGRMMLVRALTLGLQIIAVDPCANPLEKIPDNQWVNFAAFVPYQIENILESKHPHSFDRVDKVIVGGAPLRATTIEKLDAFSSDFFATYGMTETISHVALQKLNGAEKQNCFEMLPGISFDLDARNCMILNVPYLSHSIITNDVVERISPTKFQWQGRFDNIINSGGIKVNPEKIESAVARFLASTGHKERVFVHGMPDDHLGSRLVLVMEANTIDEHFLKSFYSCLSPLLSAYEIPKDMLLVSKFIETENGKINRLQTVNGFHAIVSLKR